MGRIRTVYGLKGSGLGAQARLAQGDGSEAVGDGCLHLFGTEVAFRANEDKRILTGCECLHQRFLVALIAVGDELLPGKGLGDELAEGCHRIQYGQGRLERLLHR